MFRLPYYIRSTSRCIPSLAFNKFKYLLYSNFVLSVLTNLNSRIMYTMASFVLRNANLIPYYTRSTSRWIPSLAFNNIEYLLYSNFISVPYDIFMYVCPCISGDICYSIYFNKHSPNTKT
uniref:Uncharacterized protein n=1 Tax=Cacopsylla melanoneura TaxID=428564 RepID=A0A8D8T8C2_9HEMI